MRIPSPIRVERHQLGPRCFIFGRRVHEVTAGLVLLAACLALTLAQVHLPLHLTFIFLCVGAWWTIKDWPDLFPGKRNTRSWHFLYHQGRPGIYKKAPWLPALSAVGATLIATLNILSVLSPHLSARAHHLAHLREEQLVFYAHALALPAGLVLLTMAWYLGQRRRRAWVLTVGLLCALLIINIVRGQPLAAALAVGLLALLAWGRDAYCVQPRQPRLTVAAAQAVLLVAGAFLVALTAAMVGAHWTHQTAGQQLREAWTLFTLGQPPVHFTHLMRFLALGVRTVSVGALLAAAYVLHRPLAHARALPGPADRQLAGDLVRAHGLDTLAAFKLRSDQHYYFSADGSAFLSYQVRAGVLLIASDPVGPPQAVARLLKEAIRFAHARGLRIGCVGASEEFKTTAEGEGLRSMYVGDEAIVDLRAFSLEGRAIRKVRQSVSRLSKAGYTASLSTLGDLDRKSISELEQISANWRDGQPERGFSMALDRLDGEHLHDSLVLIASDEHGQARGFLHFVPCFGREAMSLSFMRRERNTPNGLTEFLIVHAVQELRERGIEELSLNFAAFGRWLREPDGRLERTLGWLMRRLDRFFQIESLHRFNSKFFPRWQPRYLLYERSVALPRTALAALWAEGQIPELPFGSSQPAAPAGEDAPR